MVILSSKANLKEIMFGSLLLTLIVMTPSIIYTFWAQIQLGSEVRFIEWARQYGAIGPLEEIGSNIWWRAVLAPMLHAHLNHLLSNATLVFISVILLLRNSAKRCGVNRFNSYIDYKLGIFLLILMVISGVVIAIGRSCMGVESWSIGSSGAALTLLTYATSLSALSDLDLSRAFRVMMGMAPMVFFSISFGSEVDICSHGIGVVLGLLIALWHLYMER